MVASPYPQNVDQHPLWIQGKDPQERWGMCKMWDWCNSFVKNTWKHHWILSVRKDLTQDVSLVFLSPAFLLLEGIRSCLWQTLRVTWLSENNWTRVEAWHSSNFKIPEKIALPSLHSYLCIGSNEIYHVHIIIICLSYTYMHFTYLNAHGLAMEALFSLTRSPLCSRVLF